MIRKKMWKNKGLVKAIITCLSLIYMSIPIYAADASFDDTTLVKGTKNLFAAGTAAITGIVTVATIFFAVKNGLIWQNADDQEKPVKKRKFIIDIAIGVLIVCASGIITVIFSFYGVSGS